jgi:hypothetical protein
MTATNADNIYGTEVIERVRSVKKAPTHSHLKKHHHYKKPPDMVIVPFDSRNLPEMGKQTSIPILFNEGFSTDFFLLFFL